MGGGSDAPSLVCVRLAPTAIFAPEASEGRRNMAARRAPARLAAARTRRGPAGNEGAGRVPHPPAADKRRAACIRLAVLLGLVAFAFYLGMFLMGGT